MTQRLSKILLALEALLLVVPITVLFATIASDLFFSFLQFSDAWQLGLFVFVVIAASLVAGWSLMVAFWRHGPTRLRKGFSASWAIVLVGAACIVSATAILVVGNPSHWPPTVKQSLWALAWGLPLLVPLAHLLGERHLRSAANTSPERTRGG